MSETPPRAVSLQQGGYPTMMLETTAPPLPQGAIVHQLPLEKPAVPAASLLAKAEQKQRELPPPIQRAINMDALPNALAPVNIPLAPPVPTSTMPMIQMPSRQPPPPPMPMAPGMRTPDGGVLQGALRGGGGLGGPPSRGDVASDEIYSGKHRIEEHQAYLKALAQRVFFDMQVTRTLLDALNSQSTLSADEKARKVYASLEDLEFTGREAALLAAAAEMGAMQHIKNTPILAFYEYVFTVDDFVIACRAEAQQIISHLKAVREKPGVSFMLAPTQKVGEQLKPQRMVESQMRSLREHIPPPDTLLWRIKDDMRRHGRYRRGIDGLDCLLGLEGPLSPEFGAGRVYVHSFEDYDRSLLTEDAVKQYGSIAAGGKSTHVAPKTPYQRAIDEAILASYERYNDFQSLRQGLFRIHFMRENKLKGVEYSSVADYFFEMYDPSRTSTIADPIVRDRLQTKRAEQISKMLLERGDWINAFDNKFCVDALLSPKSPDWQAYPHNYIRHLWRSWTKATKYAAEFAQRGPMTLPPRGGMIGQFWSVKMYDPSFILCLGAKDPTKKNACFIVHEETQKAALSAALTADNSGWFSSMTQEQKKANERDASERLAASKPCLMAPTLIPDISIPRTGDNITERAKATLTVVGDKTKDVPGIYVVYEPKSGSAFSWSAWAARMYGEKETQGKAAYTDEFYGHLPALVYQGATTFNFTPTEAWEISDVQLQDEMLKFQGKHAISQCAAIMRAVDAVHFDSFLRDYFLHPLIRIMHETTVDDEAVLNCPAFPEMRDGVSEPWPVRRAPDGTLIPVQLQDAVYYDPSTGARRFRQDVDKTFSRCVASPALPIDSGIPMGMQSATQPHQPVVIQSGGSGSVPGVGVAPLDAIGAQPAAVPQQPQQPVAGSKKKD